jgi:hypothetical protein
MHLVSILFILKLFFNILKNPLISKIFLKSLTFQTIDYKNFSLKIYFKHNIVIYKRISDYILKLLFRMKKNINVIKQLKNINLKMKKEKNINEKVVSIIILNYNNYKLTLNCLKSLVNQTYRNFEIILVDNGSKPNLYKKLKKHLKNFENNLNIRLIRNEKNLYFATGNNKAIKKTKGKYICLLNSDTFAEPNFIEVMVNFLEDHPNAGMVTPKIKFYAKKDIIWNAGSYVNLRGILVSSHRGYLEYDPFNKKYNNIDEIEVAPATAMFLRKSMLKDVGLIDEIFLMYHEDPDWNLRAHKKGYKSYYIPNTIVYHDVSEGCIKFTTFFFIRNSQIFVWKHGKLIDLLVFYLYFYIYHIRILISELFHKKFNNFNIMLNALWKGLKVGIKRKLKISCRKNLIKDYYYARNIQNLYDS